MKQSTWQACATCGLYAIEMIQCPACDADNCIPHAVAHMESHVNEARLFIEANKAVEKNKEVVKQ